MQLDIHMIYGATGSTKTSRLGDAAEYYYERSGGKKVRGVFTDTGGFESIRSLVEGGVIEPYIVTGREGERLIETLDKLSRGWWPNAAGKLEPPQLEEVSAYIVDGLTTQCAMMMTYHESSVTYNAQTGTINSTTVRAPEMPKDSYVRSGDYVRRFTGRSDYGAVQGRIAEFIRNYGMLGVPVWSSALDTKGTDDTSKKPIYGPDFIGQAFTGKCGPLFGHLLHLSLVPVQKDEKVGGQAFRVIQAQPYLFTRNHLDPDDPYKVPYMAKARVDKRLWERMPAVMEPDLGKFLHLVEEVAKEAARTGESSALHSASKM